MNKADVKYNLFLTKSSISYSKWLRLSLVQTTILSQSVCSFKKNNGRLVQTVQRYKCLLKTLANEYGKEPLYLFQFTAPIIKIYLRMLVERISQWIWKQLFSLTICFSTKKQDKSWYDIRIEHIEECGNVLSLTIRLQQKIDDYVYWK